MAIPPKVDGLNVLKNIYEPDINRIRVDSTATVASGAFEVSITEADDSIVIYGVDDSSVHRAIHTNASGDVHVINDNLDVPLSSLGTTGNPFVTSNIPITGSFTDYSGSISTTSTEIIPANLNRRYILIHNLSGSVNMWINFTDPAGSNTAGSVQISPKGSFVMEGSFITTEAINLIATSSATYTAKEGT